MPILGRVGQKSVKTWAFTAFLHLLLSAGAVGMVYPFLMMISGSFKSAVDSKRFNLVPQYFYDDEMLFKKYIESRYNESSSLLAMQYHNPFSSFEQISLPQTPVRRVYEDWAAFLEENASRYTIFDYFVAEQYAVGVHPRNLRAFRDAVKRESHGDLAVFNRRYGTCCAAWDEIQIKEDDIYSRRFMGSTQGVLGRYRMFRETLPLRDKVFADLNGHFVENELRPYYTGLREVNAALGTAFKSWQDVVLTRTMPQGPLRDKWVNYVKKSLNLNHIKVAEAATGEYRRFLEQKYESVGLLNRTYKSAYPSFAVVEMPHKLPGSGARLEDYGYFVEHLVSPEHLQIIGPGFDYQEVLRKKYGTIERLNAAHGRGFSSFESLPLPATPPQENLAFRNAWLDFARQRAAPEVLGLSMSCQDEFATFLKTKFAGNEDGIVGRINAAYGTNFKNEQSLYPSKRVPARTAYREDWLAFARKDVSPQYLVLDVELGRTAWQSFLRENYGTVAACNRAWGLLYADFESVSVDNWTNDYFIFLEHKTGIFQEFLARNYIMVLELMLYSGRAIFNTVVFCALLMAASLLVNPLAAYALSRFKLPSTHIIILVLMLTVAFPSMVMGIPSFLVLKKLNLLNTFWALILPAAADGYFIFLLKGFFDSLPKELFECAILDGAGERTIFFRIVMPLSKPILTVIALGAFNAAYRSFMFAFIVCQDQSMWTLMVHLYQLMQISSPAVNFAALVIAAVPTLMVFIFCQKIIIRGIVVPTEK